MKLKTGLIDPQPEKRFKVFNEMYPLCAFMLAFSFIFPNRTTALKRCITITLIVTFCGGQLFWFLTYTFMTLYTLDLYNFARNMTLAVVLLLFFVKTYYVIYATQKFASLLQWMSRDLLKANNLGEDYQNIYDEHIGQSKLGEKVWLVIPTIMSTFFPLYAGICMGYESIYTDDYTRMMVHDMEMMYVEDIQNEPPFFHLYFAYNCIQCVVLVPHYGFDGSFCIATTHLRMKLKLMTHKLEKAYADAKNPFELKALVSGAISDHQDALEFYETLQDVYGPWLFTLFMVTSILISFNLYQIYLLQRLDPKSTMFGCVGVLHMFMPCHYASVLADVSDSQIRTNNLNVYNCLMTQMMVGSHAPLTAHK